jgi:hypothetical protein
MSIKIYDVELTEGQEQIVTIGLLQLFYDRRHNKEYQDQINDILIRIRDGQQKARTAKDSENDS